MSDGPTIRPIYKSPLLLGISSLILYSTGCGDPPANEPTSSLPGTEVPLTDVEPTDPPPGTSVPTAITTPTQTTISTATPIPQTPTSSAVAPSEAWETPTKSAENTAIRTPSPSPTHGQTATETSDVTATAATTPTSTALPPTPTPTLDPRCSPELSLSPETIVTPTLELVTFLATGGTGDYRFEIVENQSGSIINTGNSSNPGNGSYLSGENGGTVDTIQVTDAGCLGTAEATINIVLPLIIRPAKLQVQPDQVVNLDIQEGSGNYLCEMVRRGSEGEVSEDCSYTSGPQEGIDIIEVTDLETDRTDTLDIDVLFDAHIDAGPPTLFLPLGGSYPMALSGGSNEYVLQFEGQSAYLDENEHFIGTALGTSILTIIDEFTAQQTDITINVVEPLDFEAPRAGDHSGCSRALSPGDINQDGFPDAILSQCENDLGAYNAGAVFVYAGSENGLQPVPVQSLYGQQWLDEMGRGGVSVADLDQDGWLDLVLGRPRADLSFSDNGGVFIYRGVPGGFFEDEPSTVFAGTRNSDYLGYSTTICDFNNDGYLDIAAGAPLEEDENISGVPTGTGAAYIFLGSETGFTSTPNKTLFAYMPNGEGGWEFVKDTRLGYAIASGDFNGDERCDLIIASHEYDPPGQTNTGIALVYMAQQATEAEPVGLDSFPSFVIDGYSPNNYQGQLGRRLATGDVNNDGFTDLLIGQNRYTNDESKINQGAARLFMGSADFATQAQTVSIDEADWSVSANDNYDYLGWDVKIEDFNGDEYLDLVLGEVQGETTDGITNAGRVVIYSGTDSLPSTEPIYEYQPPNVISGDFIGEAAALLPDMDGDGLSELFVMGGRLDSYGLNVGQALLVKTLSPTEPMALELPGAASGTYFGRRMQFVDDLNADGYSDLLVGAPLADPDVSSVNGGSVFVYNGNEQGMTKQPMGALGTYPGHSGSDNFGYGLADLGDFDGDGASEFAVLSSSDDQPSSFSSNDYYEPVDCGSSRSNTGAVFVFSGDSELSEETLPDFVIYGPVVSGSPQSISGGLDFNGDGLKDIVLAGHSIDATGTDSGGVSVIFGRQKEDERIQVVCEPDVYFPGWVSGAQLGRGLATIGDSNGDGCDDVAAGAYVGDEQGLSNQGHITILYGYGKEGCPAELEMATIVSGLANTQLGYHLESGQDFNGDGILDLVAGAPNNLVGSDRNGSAFIISGKGIGELDREPASQGAPSTYTTLAVTGVLASMHGKTTGGLFGRALAVIPPTEKLGGPGVLVGAPVSDASGYERTGVARLYGFTATEDPDSLTPWEAAVFPGDSNQYDNRMGEWVSAGIVGSKVLAAVSGYQGDGPGSDLGAVYMMDLGNSLP